MRLFSLATIAHFSAVGDGLGKFLKLIQASLLLRYSSFKVNKKSVSIQSCHPVQGYSSRVFIICFFFFHWHLSMLITKKPSRIER